MAAWRGMTDQDIAVKYRDFKVQQSLMEEKTFPIRAGNAPGTWSGGRNPCSEMAESGYERIAVVTHEALSVP